MYDVIVVREARRGRMEGKEGCWGVRGWRCDGWRGRGGGMLVCGCGCVGVGEKSRSMRGRRRW